MKGMDAIAFAIERGEMEIAQLVAQHIAGPDIAKQQRLLARAHGAADSNNR